MLWLSFCSHLQNQVRGDARLALTETEGPARRGDQHLVFWLDNNLCCRPADLLLPSEQRKETRREKDKAERGGSSSRNCMSFMANIRRLSVAMAP